MTARSSESHREQPDYIYSPEDPEQEMSRSNHLPSFSSHPRSAGESSTGQVALTESEVKSHVRIQVLTPLSVLLQLTTMIICSFLVHPSLGSVGRLHPTYMSPNENFILFYWAVLYLLLIGFSTLAVLSRQSETKKALVHGVGTRLALANYLMVLWAIFWVLNRTITFELATGCLGVIALLLLYNSIVLAVWYKPSSRHPLDWLFIHVPVKMFLVVILQVDLWQQLFMALAWEAPYDLNKGLWPAFGITTGLGVLSSLWIFATGDFTWTVAGIYLNAGLLMHKKITVAGDVSRPAVHTAAIILSMALQLTALVSSLAWSRIEARREGRIALPLSPEEEAAAIRAEAEREAARARSRVSVVNEEAPVAAEPRDEEEAIESNGKSSQSKPSTNSSSSKVGVTRTIGPSQG
ncbi:hypothetical protein IE53DRAFT_384637 [Violaceomyces palustris]|uniref:Uncharacterized protein n=1 Tax=Violaceomyces palustris TaxID=1673888 RepID=A0ACD0P439_9BASI|nr:hypothetical protein IE53DRAFT_384637 [Violaceomyces palustris]